MMQDELSDTPIQLTGYSGDDRVQGMTTCESGPPKPLQYGKATLLQPKYECSTAEQQRLTCKFECERPLSVLVEIQLAGRGYDMLVDTGACVNVISGKLWDQLGFRSKLELYQGKARTVDGSLLAIEGTVKLRTQVGNVDTTVKVPECLPDSDLGPTHFNPRVTPWDDLVNVIFRQQSQEHFYKWVQKPCGLSAFSIGFLRVTSADWFASNYSSKQPLTTNGICEYPRTFGSVTLHLRNVPLPS